MTDTSEQNNQNQKVDRTERDVGLGYALGGAVALLLVPVLGFWALNKLATGTAGTTVTLGVLGILGILSLVAALGALVLIAGALGISDKRYSLGLPQGSVRAIIALTIAITVLILAVFIPQIISDADTTVSENLSQGLVAALPQDRIVSIMPVPGSGRFNVEMIMPGDDAQRGVIGRKAETTVRDGLTEAAVADLPQDSIVLITPVPGSARFNVEMIMPGDDSARDLNKQIITVISTLLVAVVAFYFGSRTVAQAREVVVVDGQPKTKQPTPDKPKPGDPKSGDPKTGGPKSGDPKTGRPKPSEPKPGDPKPGEG